MNRGHILAFVLACALSAQGADPLFESAQQKLDLIREGHAARGSVVQFTPTEANAWARTKLAETVPTGVRNLHLVFGTDTVTGAALVDFRKVREANGVESSWLISRLLEGERPVRAIIHLASINGSATVALTRVEVSNAAASGTLLDFLMRNFVKPLYPSARINEPVELDDPIERVEVRATGVRVVMKK